jgi:hypothetical protein
MHYNKYKKINLSYRIKSNFKMISITIKDINNILIIKDHINTNHPKNILTQFILK